MPRFINQDSYLGEIVTPPSLHRYLYAYANPTVYIDLLGYLSQKDLENRGTNLLYEGNYLGWTANVLAGAGYMVGNWLTGDGFEQHDVKLKQGMTAGEAAASVAKDKVNESIQTIKDEGVIKGSTTIGCAVVKQCKAAVKLAKKTGEKVSDFLNSDVTNVLKSQKNAQKKSQIKMTQESGPISTAQRNQDIIDQAGLGNLGSGQSNIRTHQAFQDIPVQGGGRSGVGSVPNNIQVEEATALKRIGVNNRSQEVIQRNKAISLKGELAKRRFEVGTSGHHVPAVRKSKGRSFEVKRSDKTRPTLHFSRSERGRAHWRLHNAEKPYVGGRTGDFNGTDDELFNAYRDAYKGLDDIFVNVKSPNGKYDLATEITPLQAIDVIEAWLKGQGLK